MNSIKYLLDTNCILGLLKATPEVFEITTEIEDLAIALRRARKVKLPDTIIAATAIHHGLELLTFDIALLSIVRSAPSA